MWTFFISLQKKFPTMWDLITKTFLFGSRACWKYEIHELTSKSPTIWNFCFYFIVYTYAASKSVIFKINVFYYYSIGICTIYLLTYKYEFNQCMNNDAQFKKHFISYKNVIKSTRDKILMIYSVGTVQSTAWSRHVTHSSIKSLSQL